MEPKERQRGWRVADQSGLKRGRGWSGQGPCRTWKPNSPKGNFGAQDQAAGVLELEVEADHGTIEKKEVGASFCCFKKKT